MLIINLDPTSKRSIQQVYPLKVLIFGCLRFLQIEYVYRDSNNCMNYHMLLAWDVT